MKNSVRLTGRKISLFGDRTSFSIIDHKAYQYFLENSKMSGRDNVSHYVEHGKIISEFYRIVAEKLVSSEGGVVLDGLGYFGIIQHFRDSGAYYDYSIKKKKLNTKTDNKIYNIAFVPIVKTSPFLKSWVFDYSFVRNLRASLSKSLKAGKKYSFNASLFFYKGTDTSNDLQK